MTVLCIVWPVEIEQLKMQLRALLHQRDMFSYERESMELDDLRQEIEEEIQELHRRIRRIA
jgi:hypothetical protein